MFQRQFVDQWFFNFKFQDLYLTYFLFLPDTLFILPHMVLTLLWEFRINLSCSIIFASLIIIGIILE